ncbi:DUF1837 domain-containing protein [Niabella sp. W65]|nr:DUF1837 domain-containing protein [Niabella sp. W65]MCH7363533.1 DUF1837 domain-containing protein [Niabella sp. W65]ULT39449.1 DUF1837 domain-containing protein [Niabella sp. I65]
MELYKKWLKPTKHPIKSDGLVWMISEDSSMRETMSEVFCNAVRSHYDELDRIGEDVADLGFENASKIFKERLPTSKKSRSGELGEILATEFVEEQLGFSVLRY